MAEVQSDLSNSAANLRNKVTTVGNSKRFKKRLVRYGLLVANLAVVAAAITFVVRNPDSQAIKSNAVNLSNSQAVNPLDTISAADIAANASILAGLPETGFVINYADSVRDDLTKPIAQGSEIVAKPQILGSEIKTKADIIKYETKKGDTLASLAVKFGVTSDSIRWSNGQVANNPEPGTKLYIPPEDGIVHVVKRGDTASSLASKYRTSKDRIVSFNDAELTGLVVGDRILIPGGEIVAPVRVNATYYSGFAFGASAIYGYNGYVPGFCTWYVADKRIKIGKPLPANLGDAWRWDDNAPQGYDRNPKAGDAVVTGSYSAPGHVAYVEEVYEDGRVKISEMNRNWQLFQVTSRVMDKSEASRYNYIH